MKKTLIFLTLLSVGLLSANAAEFFVSPKGNDENPGTAKAPFATFTRAQKAVRDARAASPDEGATVTFRSGLYSLDEEMSFLPQDSGASAEAPVCYVAERGGKVILSGGAVIRDVQWQKDEWMPGVWKTRLELKNGQRFEQLWVNGERAVRARTPNDWCFARLQGVHESALEENPQRRLHTFNITPDIMETLTGLSQQEMKDTQIQVYHKWDTTREWLKGIDAAHGILTTTGREMAKHNSMTRDCLYFLENYKQALDAPGEWFLDREGWLYYYPRKGENIHKAEFIYPRLEHLLNVSGSKGDQRVRFLEFDGIQFMHTEYHIPAEGVPPMQAAMNCSEATVLLNSAENVVFKNCAVEHTGNIGIWFQNDCHYCVFDTGRIFDVGATGVRIGETSNRPVSERTGFITVNNSIIQHGGRLHPSAIGVWIGQSSDNQITHNEISDFFYTGVSIGWVWGYAESGSQRNLVEYNHIHHLGYKILSDMGGIYTLGYSGGTILRGNVIHDVYSSNYGGWGLYPDEGTTDMLLENNLVYNTKDGGFHQHYGRDNIVRNNIFAFSDEGQVAVTRKEDHTSFTFEHNIVIFDKGKLLGYGGWAAGAKVNIDHNLYWNIDGAPIDFAGKTFEEWKASGRDQDSLIADPLFKDARRRDFHLKKGSPAEKIGFKPFDFSQAGVQGSAKWKALAKSLKYPGFGQVKKLPPIEFSEDFENPQQSLFMQNAAFNVEGHQEAIARTEESAVSGQFSLKVQDSPDMQFSYDPHLYFDPSYTEGTLHLSYKIRLEKGVVAHCEVRSEGHPYLIGPSVYFRDGGAVVRGEKVCDLPENEWIGVEISAHMGEKANGQWRMKLNLPGGTSHEFNDLACDPRWNRACWIGFCALEKTQSAFYLDDLTVRCER
ncbi:MAG: right-handed parallel beta-helix repeat-containing protein [Verrucomicrobia bacterium]|nr:right-handed parallel beta-helix repeat-containing protein [Verrucomicrobiota bacterium]